MTVLGDQDEGRRALRRDRIVAAVIGIGWGVPMTGWAFVSRGPFAGLGMLLLAVPAAVGLGLYLTARVTKRSARLS